MCFPKLPTFTKIILEKPCSRFLSHILISTTIRSELPPLNSWPPSTTSTSSRSSTSCWTGQVAPAPQHQVQILLGPRQLYIGGDSRLADEVNLLRCRLRLHPAGQDQGLAPVRLLHGRHGPQQSQALRPQVCLLHCQ